MSLRFCPKCGKILILEKIGEKNFLEKCISGHFKKLKGKPITSKEKILPKSKQGDLIPKESNEFATYPHECQKCGYNKAQIIELGVFYSDENDVVLLKCGKCGWSERVGGKVT